MIDLHISFIMDGNRRYAKKNGISAKEGYKKGMEKFLEILSYQVKYKLKETSFFALSRDNYSKRSQEELSTIFGLLEFFYKNKEIEDFIKKNKIEIEVIGDLEELERLEKKRDPTKKKVIQELKKKLESWNKSSTEKDFKTTILLNYDGQDEILHAMKKLMEKEERGEIKRNKLSKEMIKAELWYKGKSPEIIVRTGDAPRLSGFLLWDSKYSEIYFTRKLWPELNEGDFLQIFDWYKTIKRNFGN